MASAHDCALSPCRARRDREAFCGGEVAPGLTPQDSYGTAHSESKTAGRRPCLASRGTRALAAKGVWFFGP